MNKESFHNLFNYYLPLLRHKALKYTRDWDDAEDLLQDTFTKGFQKMELYKTDTNMKRWLLQIMKNTYLDNKKRAHTHKHALRKMEQFDRDDSWMRPEFKTDHNFYAEHINRSLLSLSWKLRSAFLLKEAGCTYSEISKLTGVSNGTAASRVYKAKTELKRKLQYIIKNDEQLSDEKKSNDD